jgi:hypothetical protein
MRPTGAESYGAGRWLADTVSGDLPPVSEAFDERPSELAQRHRAAGIYGTVVTAAVLAAAGNELTTFELAASVIVTLLVYWLADQYAHTLASYAHPDHFPARAEILRSLGATWPMVSATFLPVLALLLAHLAGGSIEVAGDVGLAVALSLLIYQAWSVGRRAGFRGVRMLGAMVVAVSLGGAMVAMKAGLEFLGH